MELPHEAWLGLGLFAIVVSLVALVACIADKRRAQRGAGRFRERTLLLLALIGGSPGLLLGMVAVRHKVRKASFLVRFLAIVALQGVLVAFLLYEGT